jgi:hypothetical protein
MNCRFSLNNLVSGGKQRFWDGRAAVMRLRLGEPRQQLLNRRASTVSTANSLSAGRSSDQPFPKTQPQ